MRWMQVTSGRRWSGKYVLAARHDDDLINTITYAKKKQYLKPFKSVQINIKLDKNTW